MQQLIICRGLPASGKSTFAKAWVLEDPEHRVRVNRDDIRRMLGPYWIPSREDLVTDLEKMSTIKALSRKYSVIIDATNFRSHWLDAVNLAEMFPDKTWFGLQVQVVIKDFTDVSIETCIERDNLRSKEEQVGEEVIRNMYNKYLKK